MSRPEGITHALATHRRAELREWIIIMPIMLSIGLELPSLGMSHFGH